MSTSCAELRGLSMHPLFAGLTQAELNALSGYWHTKEFRAGAIIYRERARGDELAIILDGRVKVSKQSKDGKELLIALLNKGDILGEIAVLTDSHRSADVHALTNTRVLVLSKDVVNEHLRRFTGFSRNLLRYLANRVRAMNLRLADIALYDVTQRVGRILLELSTLNEEQGVYVVQDRPTHQDLASMAGASREAVTRALNLLSKEGHLELDDRQIRIYSLPGI